MSGPLRRRAWVLVILAAVSSPAVGMHPTSVGDERALVTSWFGSLGAGGAWRLAEDEPALPHAISRPSALPPEVTGEPGRFPEQARALLRGWPPLPGEGPVGPASHPEPLGGGGSWGTQTSALPAGDLTGDGVVDVAALRATRPNGPLSLTAISGSDGADVWSVQFPFALDVIPLRVGDLDSDGADDLLALEFRIDDVVCPLVLRCRAEIDDVHRRVAHSWTMHALSGPTGADRWTEFRGETAGATDPATGLRVTESTSALVLPFVADDLDGDGRPEVVVNQIDLVTVSNGPASLLLTGTRAHVAASSFDGHSLLSRERPPAPGDALLVPAGDAVGNQLGDLLWQSLPSAAAADACSTLGQCGLTREVATTIQMIDGASLQVFWETGVQRAADRISRAGSHFAVIEGTESGCGAVATLLGDCVRNAVPQTCEAVAAAAEFADASAVVGLCDGLGQAGFVDALLRPLMRDVDDDGRDDLLLLESIGGVRPLTRVGVVSGLGGFMPWAPILFEGDAAPVAVGHLMASDPDVGRLLTIAPFGTSEPFRYWDLSGDGVLGSLDAAYLARSGFVGVNDLRLAFPLGYGTAVTNVSVDAVAELTPMSGARFCFADDDGNESFDPGEGLYLDADAGPACGRVGHADVRLAPFGSLPAGRRVRVSDGDFGDELRDLPFVEIDRYDADANDHTNRGDTLYANIFGGDDTVSVGDVRLTAFGSQAPGTHVQEGDADLGLALADADLVVPGHAWFWDQNRDGVHSGDDVAYVSRDAFATINDLRLTPFGQEAPGAFVAPDDAEPVRFLERAGLAPRFCFQDRDGGGYGMGDPVYLDLDGASGCGRVSVHDLRITPVGSNAAGSMVRSGDSDFDDPLGEFAPGPAELEAFDFNGDGRFTEGDRLYLNVVGGDDLVTPGDVRLFVGRDDEPGAGTTVASGDGDERVSLVGPSFDVAAHLAYADLDGDARPSHAEPVYLSDGSFVTVHDVHLSAPEPSPLPPLPAMDAAGTDAYGAVVRRDSPDVVAELAVAADGALCFHDSEEDGDYSPGDPVYLDPRAPDAESCAPSVAVDDLRLTPFRGGSVFDDEIAGSFVSAFSEDLGLPLMSLAAASPSTPEFEAYDADFDQGLGAGDTVYLNVNGSDDRVSPGDIRLAAVGSLPAGSAVGFNGFADDLVVARVDRPPATSSAVLVAELERVDGASGRSYGIARREFPVPSGGSATADFAPAGDADGDGRQDFLLNVVLAASGSSTSHMIVVSGASGASLHETTVPGDWFASAAGDLDGDGRADVLRRGVAAGGGETTVTLRAVRMPAGTQLWQRADAFVGGTDRLAAVVAPLTGSPAAVLYVRAQLQPTGLVLSRLDGLAADTGAGLWGFGDPLAPPSPVDYVPFPIAPTSLNHAGWTRLPLGDEEVRTIAIPPTPFYDATASSLAVSSNGWASPGGLPADAACCGSRLLPNPDGRDGLIAGYWADLDPSACADGGVFVRVTPDIVRVAFDRVALFGAHCHPPLPPPLQESDRVSFLITMRTASGEIEVHLFEAPDGGLATTGVESPEALRGDMVRRSDQAVETPLAWRFLRSS